MDNTDPVVNALDSLLSTTPVELTPLIDSYKEHGVEELEQVWKQIVCGDGDENQ